MESEQVTIFEELLIEEMKKYPNLWRVFPVSFADKQATHSSWQEIVDTLASNNINVSVDDCKKKWRYFRDNYLKQKKKEVTRRVTWKYFDHLSFLSEIIDKSGDAVIKPSPSDIVDKSEDAVDTSMAATSHDEEFPKVKLQPSVTEQPRRRKRKLNSDLLTTEQRQEIVECMRIWREKQSQRYSDGLEGFADHIISTIRCLRPELAIEAKYEIQQILYRCEIENLTVIPSTSQDLDRHE